METLPNFIGKLKDLTLLDLRHNKITTLPTELADLPNLTKLDFGHNRNDSHSPAIPEFIELDAKEEDEQVVGQVPVPKEVVNAGGSDLIAYLNEYPPPPLLPQTTDG